MKKHALILFSAFLLYFFGCNGAVPVAAPANGSPQRVVSTVPSITEILFDIGVGDRLVGDSKFTIYPPETEKIEKIGGLYDIDWERLIALRPDLAIILTENDAVRQRLQDLRIETLLVDHRGLDGVLRSYDQIGAKFGSDVAQTAQKRKEAFQTALNALETKTAPMEKVRVMICLDRTRGGGRLQNVFIAGTNPFFQDAIRLAGGVNVGAESGIPVPNVSMEGILAMNPDVIVDLLTGEGSVASAKLSEEQLQTKVVDTVNDWKTLGNSVNAVKNGRIHLLTDDFTTIPGPRTPQFVEKLIGILHPQK